MTLSRPQIDALRYAKGRQLFAKDINEGNGNLRRTLLSLFKIGMLSWDPIRTGRVVLTPEGNDHLQRAITKKLRRVSGTIDDPRSALRIARAARAASAKEEESQ